MSSPTPDRSQARRTALWWALLAVAWLLVLGLAPLAGAAEISLPRALGFGVPEGEFNPDAQILFHSRLPRVLFALVAGGLLALSGAVYQAILRNDLADPYVLGVSGGAGFGALLVLTLAPAAVVAFLLPAAAFAIAAAAVLLIYGMSRWRGPHTPPATFLLAGITLNLLFGAGILLTQYLSDPYQTFRMIRWLMGGVDVGSYRVVAFVAGVGGAASLVIVWRARHLDLLSLGEQTAHHLGVPVASTRRLALFGASLVAAVVVAYAGPIGFVGLIVPHLLRLVVGPDNRVLLVACLLGGGVFLALCDTLARTVLAPTELPVGVVTAFTGAPFFLWLLFRKV